MKKVTVLLLVCVMLVGLFGCGAKEQAEVKSDDKLVFGYVVNDMSHEWYQNIVKGAQKRADELGVELKVADSALDVSKQVSQIENLLTEGVDVQIITPVDVKALAAVVADAKASNIPVVSESNVIDGAETYVGIDNVSGGKKAGLWFAEYAKENNSGTESADAALPLEALPL